MKCMKLAGLVLGASVLCASAQTPETFILIKISNFDGAVAVDVVSPAKLAELRKDIALENKLIKDAYGNVSKEWRKSHEGKTVKQTINYKDMKREVEVKAPIPPFPLKRPGQREISQSGVFPTAEAAAERKAALEATMKAAAPKKPEEDAKDKDKDKEKPKSGGKKGAAKVEEVDIEQLFQSMMSELATLKSEAMTPAAKGVGTKKQEGKSGK